MTTKRQCGDCQLCCRLLPTEEIGKVANVRCQYQKAGKGCAIHSRKPMSCSLWNCRWLVDDDCADQLRPDRSHIVIDIMPDVLRMVEEATATGRPWSWQTGETLTAYPSMTSTANTSSL